MTKLIKSKKKIVGGFFSSKTKLSFHPLLKLNTFCTIHTIKREGKKLADSIKTTCAPHQAAKLVRNLTKGTEKSTNE